MADDVTRLQVELVAVVDRYLANMRAAGDAARVTGQQIQGSLGSTSYWDAAAKAQQTATGELLVSSRAWSGATKAMVAGNADVAASLAQVKAEVPKSGGAEEHGISSLTDALRHMRTEGRMAGFIGRQLSEVGLVGGEAGRAIGVAMLATAGGVGLVIGAVELAIMGVKALVEHFEKVKEAEEEARKTAREMALEIRLVGLEVGQGWERFRSGQESEGLPSAVRRAREEMERFGHEATAAGTKLDSARQDLERLADKSHMLVGPEAATKVVPGADPLGGIGIKTKTFPDLAALGQYLVNFGDKTGKETGQKYLESLKAQLVAQAGALAVPPGLGASLHVETEEKRLTVTRQVHGEQMRFAGEELKAATETEDKLAEIDRQREKLAGTRAAFGRTFNPREAASLQADIDEQDAELVRKRDATERAGGVAVVKARQAVSLQLQGIEIKAAQVTATDRQRIVLQSEEQIAKLRSERSVAAKVDPARASQLTAEIGATERLRDVQLQRFDTERSIAQQAEVRASRTREEEITADAIRQAEIRGTTELAALTDRLLLAQAKKGADRASEVAHVERLIELQRAYNAEVVTLTTMQEQRTQAAELRAMEGQLAQARAGGSQRGSVAFEGETAMLNLLGQREEAYEKLRYAKAQLSTAGAGEQAGAEADVASAQRSVDFLNQKLGLQQQINGARLAELDTSLAITAEQMREVGFDAEKQRALSGVTSNARREMQTAQSARAAGLITPEEFERWKAEIAQGSAEAAELAKRPWIRDFAGGVSTSIGSLFRQLAIEGKSFGDAMKAVALSIADTFVGIGEKLLEKGFTKLITSQLAGTPLDVLVKDPAQVEATLALQADTVATNANTTALTSLTAQLASSQVTGAAGGLSGLGSAAASGAPYFLAAPTATGATATAAGVAPWAGAAPLVTGSGSGAAAAGAAGASALGGMAMGGGAIAAGYGITKGFQSLTGIDKLPGLDKGWQTDVSMMFPLVGAMGVYMGKGLWEGGKLFLDKVPGALKDAGSWIVNAFKDAGSAIVSGIGSVVSWIGGAAGDIGGGIWGGIKSIGGFIGGLFAEGGRPPVGVASIVGEKGPELFVPDTAGLVVSNRDMPRYLGATALSNWQAPALGGGPSYEMPSFSTGGIYRAASQGASNAAGSMSSASARGHAPVPIQLNYSPQISAMDGQDVKRVLERHQTQLVEAMDNLVRRGRFGKQP